VPDNRSDLAILYAAKSTKDEKGSIATQLGDAEAAALAEGRAIAGSYEDENESAYHGNRGPELEAALDHAERIGAELWVQHSDRLARGDGVKARHLVQLVFEAKARGIRLRSVEDDASLENVVMAAVMGERNTEDSRRKAAATKAGMDRKRQRGEYIGHRPYGYKWERDEKDDRQIVPDPDQAPIIRRIFKEYLAGQSQKAIARNLTRDKVPTSRGGTRWYSGTIRQILARPLYAGWIPDGKGGVLEGIHEPMISREEWNQVEDLRKAKARGPGRGRPVAGRHLFRGGFLRCGACGGALIPRTMPNRASPPSEIYLCFTRHCDLDECSQGPIRRVEIDGAVLAYFEQVGLDLDATRDELAAAMDRKIEETRALLRAAQKDAATAADRLARVKSDYLNGDLTAAEWRELRAELEPSTAAASAEVERLTEQLHSHECDGAAEVAEREVYELLRQIRETVTGSAADAAGAEAVSATLLRLFDHFTYHVGIPERANVELIDAQSWIEPTIRPDAIQRGGDEDFPLPSREPLGQAANKGHKGFVM
jgi:DNA invertase Pin-like site-specific DNA recombinase